MTDWNHIAKIAQAMADGETVQERDKNEGVWCDWDGSAPMFDSDNWEYRIKPKEPEPEKAWLCWDFDRKTSSRVFPSPKYDGAVEHWDNYRLIEIPEENG